MVWSGRVGSEMKALWRWLCTFGTAASAVILPLAPWLAAQETPAAATKQTAPEAAAPKEADPRAAPKEPIEHRPYRISFHLGCDPAARFDELRRAELLREWQVLVRRFIGTPWVLSIAASSSPLCARDPATVDNAAFAGFTDFDKVLAGPNCCRRRQFFLRAGWQRIRHRDPAARTDSPASRLLADRRPPRAVEVLTRPLQPHGRHRGARRRQSAVDRSRSGA